MKDDRKGVFVEYTIPLKTWENFETLKEILRFLYGRPTYFEKTELKEIYEWELKEKKFRIEKSPSAITVSLRYFIPCDEIEKEDFGIDRYFEKQLEEIYKEFVNKISRLNENS